MEQIAEFLLTIGGLLLLGLATDLLGKRTFLPRVTLLLLFGILVGKEMFNLIPSLVTDRFELVADMTLLMVGFLLGSKLTSKTMISSGKQMMLISICSVIGTVVIVTLGLTLAGLSVESAILLGCIATATAPAATLDIVSESNFKGPFADLLLAIVAIDDAWALIIFSFGMALTKAMSNGDGMLLPVLFAAMEMGGAVILGLLIGLPAAYLTGRIKSGQPMLTEALGIVFICGGIAIWLQVPFLIASMVMGSVIANLAKHHEYPFHEIENIEWPFMVIFFILAGASLELSVLRELGIFGTVYIISRIAGKVLGSWIGAKHSGADSTTRHWMGIAMLPQAGVAIGMALVASSQFPEYSQNILSIIISTTILFEILGPIFTRMALNKAQNA
jgi:Kef-type K+ transport system membrane component KefB